MIAIFSYRRLFLHSYLHGWQAFFVIQVSLPCRVRSVASYSCTVAFVINSFENKLWCLTNSLWCVREEHTRICIHSMCKPWCVCYPDCEGQFHYVHCVLTREDNEFMAVTLSNSKWFTSRLVNRFVVLWLLTTQPHLLTCLYTTLWNIFGLKIALSETILYTI